MKKSLPAIIIFIVMLIIYWLVDKIYEAIFDKEMNIILFIIVTLIIGFFAANHLISKSKRLRVEEICNDYLEKFQLQRDPLVEKSIMKSLRYRLNQNKNYFNSYHTEEEFDECALRQLVYVCYSLLPHSGCYKGSLTYSPTLYNIGQDAIKTLVEKGYIDEASGKAIKDELSYTFENRKF